MASAATDQKWFRQVLGQYPTGVCVVTAAPDEGPRAGFVIGSFTSVSLDPPMVAFFPDKVSTSWPRIHEVGRFCINVLGAEQEHVCRRFAAKAPDKFVDLETRESPHTGSPIIDDVVAWIDCELESVQEAGDHFYVLARVHALDIESDALPLLFFQGGYGAFAPRSLAAGSGGGELTEQLREVDLVRSDMEALAADLSARCICTALSGDSVVVCASAGGSFTSTAATLVGQRFPYAPPASSVFAAWGDAAHVDRWLASLESEAGRSAQHDSLRAVRERGYSVGLISDAQREFASAADRIAQEPGAVSHEELSGLLSDLSYDPPELDDTAKRAIRSITAPVFGPGGDVLLALTVYGFGRPGDSIDGHVRRVQEAGRRATERVGGAAPA